MKKLALVPLLCLFIACSNDNSPIPSEFEEREEQEDVDDSSTLNTDSILNGYTFKDFNTNNGRILDSCFFELEDNRIVYATEVEMGIQRFTTNEYTYIGDNISEITTFRNGEMTRKRNFSYRGNRLTEMLYEVANSSNSQFYKYTFTHTADTIFMTHRFSGNGVDYEREVDDAKLLLDENDNLLFYENYNYERGETVRIRLAFDAQYNPVSEVHSTVVDNVEVPLRTDNISFDESRNPVYDAVMNTYGKKTTMLLYHIQVNDLSMINARVISPNALNRFQSNALENRFTFEINNEVNEDGFSELCSYKTFTQGNLTRHIEIEFIGR